MKNRKLYNTIISSVWCLCENNILYKFQVTLVTFDSFLLSSKILKDTKNLRWKQIDLGISSAPFISFIMNLNAAQTITI